jgi:hypothetical protein
MPSRGNLRKPRALKITSACTMSRNRTVVAHNKEKARTIIWKGEEFRGYRNRIPSRLHAGRTLFLQKLGTSPRRQTSSCPYR